jgi:hypothetical protein
VLPKPVDKAIKRLREAGLSNFELIWRTSDAQRHHNVEEIQVIANYFRNKKNYDDLLEALVNGYEVEQTPMEKAAAYIEELGRLYSCDECRKNEYQACLKLLHILDIKIEGINA